MTKLKLSKKKNNKPSLNTILEHNMILKFMLDYIFFLVLTCVSLYPFKM